MTTMRRVGVYVDGSSMDANGGHMMRYEVLRALAGRAGATIQRLHAYLSFDERRASRSPDYDTRMKAYQAALRDKGFRVTVKALRHYADEDGTETIKSNSDLGMAIDALSESDRLDTVLIATSDGDFAEVVRALQKKGCRVEVLGFDNVAAELRDAADQFISGYLVPGLLPVRDWGAGGPAWGQVGSRVRGICNRFEPDDGYGFIAFWPSLPDTPLLAAAETSPAYFRSSSVQDPSVLLRLPSRSTVLEFELATPAKQNGAPEARRIQIVSGA
ncbi:NYN domain-containing protein [Burkholderia vietnamiensis]|uniref:LabA-like NYN domain-containing protein n=1 Tax=Burkholderia vietnamiensis TaxID=60552 RepID=UPI001B959291|nr:NYN domain-containing protein [Burkholderia vietnamiensis]MBR8036351.1 NYN domain-containing protein [Burkholderia vietnamiensis]